MAPPGLPQLGEASDLWDNTRRVYDHRHPQDYYDLSGNSEYIRSSANRPLDSAIIVLRQQCFNNATTFGSYQDWRHACQMLQPAIGSLWKRLQLAAQLTKEVGVLSLVAGSCRSMIAVWLCPPFTLTISTFYLKPVSSVLCSLYIVRLSKSI